MKVHTLKLKNHNFTKQEGVFISSVLNKYFEGKYSYGNQLSSSKLKNEDFKIKLPCRNGKIDFSMMETLISAIQKLVIKDVVLYADKKIKATKTIVNKLDNIDTIKLYCFDFL
ncbi:MAG: hypothetical protein Q4F88_02185 [Eubacteriales bacterium]|nr:hypothetical protein [Eubacteriales bacterium]